MTAHTPTDTINNPKQSPTTSVVGAQIRAFLADRGMSQGDLARATRYDPAAISNFISGKRRINETFRWRWMEAFGVRALHVLDSNDDAPQQ